MKEVWDFDALYCTLQIDGKDIICHYPPSDKEMVKPMEGQRDYLLGRILMRNGFEHVAIFNGNVDYKRSRYHNTYYLELL